MVEPMCPYPELAEGPEPAEGPELAEGVVDFSLPDLFICRSICVGMTTYNSRLMTTYTFYGIIIPFGRINIPWGV